MKTYCIDSHYIYAKEKEFLSEDAVNVSADEEGVMKCCFPVDSTAKQHPSP